MRAFTADFSSGSAGTGESVLLSRGGGSEPRWRVDGREVYYLAPDGIMMAVSVDSSLTFAAGAPTALFQTPPRTLLGDVSADGKQFC